MDEVVWSAGDVVRQLVYALDGVRVEELGAVIEVERYDGGGLVVVLRSRDPLTDRVEREQRVVLVVGGV